MAIGKAEQRQEGQQEGKASHKLHLRANDRIGLLLYDFVHEKFRLTGHPAAALAPTHVNPLTNVISVPTTATHALGKAKKA
jgi:hypothetical protein